MSRFDELKRLKDEISRLFHEGFDADTVFKQLRADDQFAKASYEQVQAFYSHLQEEFNVEAEDNRQVAVFEQRHMEHQQIFEHLQRIEENEEQITEYKRKLVREKQMVTEMKTEMELMIKYRQNSSNFLIHDELFVNQTFFKNFWQKRFFMTAEIDDLTNRLFTIKVQDLFQGSTKLFTIQSGRIGLRIFALKFPFVLFRGLSFLDHSTFFRLAKFDFESGSLKVLQSFQFNDYCRILVNVSDASKFLLCKENDLKECKVVNDQIQFGEEVASKSDFNIDCVSYFDKQLCSLRFERSTDNQFRSRQLTQVKMLVYDLERGAHSTQDLDSTPENFNCLDSENPNSSAWICDTVFFTGQLILTLKYGIIFTSPQVRNWKVVEFATDLRINHIQTFADGVLMICSEEVQSKRKIYSLQMRKPDFLRNMAWASMIKLLKEAKTSNPYEEARQYLPFNSDIQPLFSRKIKKTSNPLFKFFSDIYHSLFSCF